MKRLRLLAVPSLVTVLLGSGSFAPNLQAQSELAITVSVPNAFTAGTETFAPGTYRFTQEFDPFVLSVLNVETGGERLFSVAPGRQGATEQYGYAVFSKSGGSSVLDQVHFPGTDTFSELVHRPRHGRIVANQSSGKKTVYIAQK